MVEVGILVVVEWVAVVSLVESWRRAAMSLALIGTGGETGDE